MTSHFRSALIVTCNRVNCENCLHTLTMSDGDRPAAWQCVHCLQRLPAVPPDVHLPFCPFCSCPQSPRTEGRRCRNPDCRAQLVIPNAPFCHKCQTRQQPEQQQSEQIAHPGLSAGSCDCEVRQLAQPQPGQPPLQQQPDQPPPQLQPGQPPPKLQPGQPPPKLQPDQPPPKLQPGQPPPQTQPGQSPPQQQPCQPPPPQAQPGQSPPQQEPGQPPPPQAQPGQSPPQQEPGQLPPQQQQLGLLPPQQLQPGQSPPQQRPDQPPPQSQPGQPSPKLQPDQPPPRLQPGQPPPQLQHDQPPPKPQQGQSLFQQQLGGQLPPPPQTGQPSSLLQTPLQSQPGQLLSRPQPGQPDAISSQQPCNGFQPEATSESSQQSDSFDVTRQNQDIEEKGMEAGNTTSSQEPWNGPQPLQPIATSEHSQQLQQRASFDGPKQTQDTVKEGKKTGNTTSSQEPRNGSQPLQPKTTSESSQQEASFGGTIPQTSSSGDESTMHQKPEKEEPLSPGAQKQTTPENSDMDMPHPPPPKTPQWQHDHSKQPELKGFQSPVEKSIQITFHVLVPLPLWDWDSSSNSCMHIRFGHKDLGNWKENCGNMTQKDLDNDWCEMSCTLQIDAEILRFPIPYKYVIYSPKMEHKDDCYEYCHAYSSNPNRCLWMAPVKYQQAYGGSYHQYDSVVYPRSVKTSDTAVNPKDIKTTKSFFQRAKTKAKALFRSSSQPKEEENVLSPLDMGRLCLQVYLDEYKQMLSSGSFANLKTTVEEICHIFHLLCYPTICNHNSTQPSTKHLDVKFYEVMKGWLESVVDALQDGAAENTVKQLASALCVTHCLLKVGMFNLKVEKLALSVVRMLQLKPDLKRKECPDYAYLCEILPQKCRTEVASSVAYLCKETRKENFRECSWLLALPLYHFLKGISTPYQTLVLDPEKISFSLEQALDLDGFKHKTYSSEKGFIGDKFDSFEHLFILDPLLLHVIIYICPKKDLASLFERIHPVLSTTWLNHMVSDVTTRVFNKHEAKKWKKWLSKIQQMTIKSVKEEVDPQVFVYMVTAALSLNRQLTAVLMSHTPHCVEVLKHSISLILSALAQLKVHFPSGEKGEVIQRAFFSLKDTLWKWIVHPDVIGGSVFGGSLPVYTSSMGMWKRKEELELWQSLLTLECPSDQQFTKEWHKIASAHIQKRIDAVPDKWKIYLVCLLEQHESLHTILTDALMEVGTIAVDVIFSKHAEGEEQDFERLVATQSTHVGMLLGNLLKKKYPNMQPGTEITISLDEVLQWSLWPNFIKLYGSNSRLKAGLPDECQFACVTALSLFQDVFDRLQTHSVSITELQKIKDNLGQMKRLCGAATARKGSGQLSYKAVDSALLQIMEEFDAFEEHRSHLSHLCLNIPDVHGLNHLKEELRKDFSQEKICTLCVRENQQIRVICFQSADSLSSLTENFYIMNHKHSSVLFTVIWREAMEAAFRNNPGGSLTLADIQPKVWDPAFHSCQSLLQELHDHSIKLTHVDKRFKHHKISNLEDQLRELFAGVNACLGENRSGAWIRGVVRRIHHYWHLCNYRKAADAFLDLREALNLQKGDFSNVEKLATEMIGSMQDQTLETVDEKLVKTGRFLEGISSDPRKLECLKCFAECQEVIKWLRGVTNDVNDLQNFVNVALATAAGGEDDLAHDKLSNLRTVGSMFGPLIYKLPTSAGYAVLAKRWESLWQTLQNSQDLPKKLKYCNQQLEWYKSVKDTQGSIEFTSFGKMRNVLRYGHYRVDSNSTQTVQSIHDMIHLNLEGTGKQLPQTNFSLDDLRDLESKLVLITGSKSKNRKEVDQFLNTLHSVCQIAEVLLELQQKGNVKYTGWTLSFHCKVNMVDTLQQQAKQMEEELQTWEDEVQQFRKEYYELNYYTTVQLLALRKELGKLKISGQPHAHTQINRQILALLESISTKISSPCIIEVVKSVLAEQQSRETSGFTAQHHTSVELLPASMARPTSQVFPSVQPIRPSVADNILASAGVEASASSSRAKLQQPKLTQDQLSQKQKEIFDNLMNYDYSKQLILIALGKFGEDQHEAENWIIENASQYSLSDAESEGTDFDGEEEADSDSETESELKVVPKATPLQFSIATNDSSTTPKLKGHSTPEMDQIEIRITKKQRVDEFHPTVQVLVEAGYSMEQSIHAVEHDDRLEGAMDYLLQSTRKGGIFHVSASNEEYRARRMELLVDSQQERVTDRDRTLTIKQDENADKRYLMLPELGRVLQELRRALPATVSKPRPFPSDVLKLGSPNLLVIKPEKVLKTALALYMYGGDVTLPLPTHEEVLICNQSTTTEEVTLLWQRAIGDPGFMRIFCLLHAEKLSYQVCDQALRSLTELFLGKKQDYRLVIICSDEDEDKSHIISRLSTHRQHFSALHSVAKYRQYLKTHFTFLPAHQSVRAKQQVAASLVDCENSCVRVVSSTRSGMGKSLFITRMAEKLKKYNCENSCVRVVSSTRSGMGKSLFFTRMAEKLKTTGTTLVTIPIHGPEVTPDIILEFLKDHINVATSTILHFDIAPTTLWKVDTILFCLLILRGLSDSQGRVWRCHPTQLYAIEVTLLEQQQQQPQQAGQHVIPESSTLALLDLLPSVECLSPQQALQQMKTSTENVSVECLSPQQALQQMKTSTENVFKVVMDRQEFESMHYQRVYQYLRRHIEQCDLDRFSYNGRVEGTPANCLKIILHSCGLRNPSWAEIRHFVTFLDVQLQSCEASVFCDQTFIGDVMAGLKGFVVKFMIRMSRDFATSSLHGEVMREEAISPMVGEEDLQLEQYKIVERRRWEHSSHPYIFFNQDGMSITFVGFMVTQKGDLIDPTHHGVLEKAIMTQQLYTGLKLNKVNFEEDYRTWKKQTMIEKITTVMGVNLSRDPDKSYVLTVDNLIKILAIQMKFRCGIPVVIMGETGCGKTRLIRYMCSLASQGTNRNNMLIMKVHGGITESDITKFVENAEKEAMRNSRHKLDTVVFFDEANTTDAIGLIKEIMCDHRLHGKPISRDLKFIAACNPYRKHSEEMIKKLESAGLGFYVRATETQQKLGKIPLRQLVYRVLDLPPSMRPLVYDFGQLTTWTEEDYTKQIVLDHVMKHPVLRKQRSIIPAIARVLAWSQCYMRNRQDECSFVSLRDVERTMIVFEFFFDKMGVFGPKMDEKASQAPEPITRSLVLAISVCYHARLQEREDYEKDVTAQFIAPLSLPGGATQFRNEVQCCQEVLLDSMSLGPNIARNAALRENVFMIAICIELRIPLFLVGKPGSSKSLAKSIVQTSMQGAASNSELLRGFKQVHIFSYQCSQLSTSKSVIEVFNTAKRFQRNQDTSKYVSVVVLDEVGLAEDSPNLPLKALHPLLEDGTEGADSKEEYIDREKRVAFIGISNWALDPAKMNRGIMVTRGNPDTNELQLSAQGICSNKVDDPVKGMLESFFEPLAKAYEKICEKQKREFFGLRDFYCLVKMLYWMCEKSGRPPTWPQLEHAIRRNFGGIELDELDTLEEFKSRIQVKWTPDLQSISEELHSIVNPDCSRLGLIKTSLMTKETSWHGENRYLLFLTENYAALEILRHYLNDVVRSSVLDLTAHDTPGSDDDGARLLEKMEPFILFGSSFPKDKEYTQVCRNINQIKICMETGRTVILLNLENLYESLYDVLNQYYMYLGDSRYVDLGLQTHRVKCRVNDNFKLIVIAEKKTVYEKFPTPLINRLEKHFVLTSSVLTEWQLDVLHHFQNWIHQFSSVTGTSGGRKFTEGEAFIGYQNDTPAAVVFQATRQLERESPTVSLQRKKSVNDLEPRAVEEEEDLQSWKQSVLKRSQYLLLQTAYPDALVRLENSPLADQREELLSLYFQQHHSSLEDFMAYHLQRGGIQEESLLMQVTTHSHLLSHDELDCISNTLSLDQSHVHAFSLQEFDTELDFSNKVSLAFQRRAGDAYHSLLVIQCDSGHLNSDLIACARYRIYDKKTEATLQNEGKGCTHILFIIHLPRQLVGSMFVGFQGDPWISTHIDNLRATNDTVMLHEAIGVPISQLFYGGVATSEGLEAPNKAEPHPLTPDAAKIPVGQILPSLPSRSDLEGDSDSHTAPPVERSHNSQFKRLHGCIQQAASRLYDSARNKERATKRVSILVNLIPRNPSFPPDDSTFHGILVRHIHKLLKERDHVREDERNWILNEALSSRKLQNGGTFQNVLARKLDEVLVPILSEIIALLDRNYNLNHLNTKEKTSPLYQFWLAMFRNQQLHYEDMVSQGMHRERVPGAGGRMAEGDFKCQLPFSWLVKEAVDSQWHSAKSTSGGSSRSLHLQLCELVSQTAIGKALESVEKAYCEELYQYYLHDFVRSVHRCYHKQQKSENLEYKLISDALDSLVHGPEFDDHESLTGRITALHIVYHFEKPKVFWFGQLVSHLPGTMTALEDKVPHDGNEMVLHLYAVDHALGQLEAPLTKRESEDKEKAVLNSWLNQLRLSHNTINFILNLPSQSELANRTRLKWQLIRALQMFVEHVVLNHEGILLYLRRLQLHLKSDADFLKASTVERVKKHLNSMDTELKKKLKSHPKKLASIQNSCRAFFMELVSTLCFGTHLAPEPPLIAMLINTVFKEREETEMETQELSPYRETKSDKVPVIRSFLLQLLLEHSTEQVKENLEDYFQKSQQACMQGGLDQNLCLLCIQCFEDSLNKEYTQKLSQERAAEILQEGHLALSHSHTRISLAYIEGVAKVRFALSVVAELFQKHVAMKPAFLHAVREVYTDTSINQVNGTKQGDKIGPVFYLLKLIVRQFGFSCLAEVSAVHTWFVPPELKGQDEIVDPFVIYNPLYSDLRKCVSRSLYEKQLQRLTASSMNLALRDTPLLLLGLYEKVTLSRASTHLSRELLSADVLERLNKFILKCKVLPNELKVMARLLVANEQGGPLAQLVVDSLQPPKHRTLGAIIVHTAAVFLCRQRVAILQPFVNMLKNPATLVNAFLPTMPEDYLLEAKSALAHAGKFYECPRGHPYFLSECGRPWEMGKCNVCGADIGGTMHKLTEENKEARSHDTTQTGYALGKPEGRSTVPCPERGLSPAGCCLVRAVMHSALLWASCNNESAIEGLLQLVKVDIRPQDLPEFFWCHLERDMELLGTATGKSLDDCAIIVHLVLREMLLRDPPTLTTVNPLETKKTREEWESIFNQNYIQPILQGLEQRLKEALHLILSDDQVEHDQLFCLVYEHVEVAEGSLDPHLWAYRSRITLEHLRQTLQQQNMRKKCPILYEFLQEEPNLRATQYLPGIVRLQQCLYDNFHHRLDRKEARAMTIGEFLQSRKHENIRMQYQEMFEQLQKAWELVGEKLRDHARLKVEEKYLLPSFTLDTPLEYLIPTTVGAGACTTALTDFLVLTHNNFIETCRAIVIEQFKSKAQWREHKVPITHIHGCHLLTYEQKLPSLILSHCHYSLVIGKGQDISYDFPALEKNLLDRFIHGKPFILSDIPQVVYRKDVYTAATFAAVRKKVPQKSLHPRTQQEIIRELRTPDRLREALDVVDIVLGFLSTGGGRADQSLGKYINNTLKMKRRPFSEKARDCTLGDILSLWQTLSVELARQLTLQQQEPFDMESMPEHSHEKLRTDGDENQVEALNRCLRVLELDNLLGTLFEFVEIFVKHSPANEKEWPLVDTLEFFLERNGLPAIKNFRDEFPETITLAQAMAVWKHIVWYQNRLGTHGTN